MIAFIDIETGGFSIEKNGVCEIFTVVIPETPDMTNIDYHCLIKPYKRPNSDELVSYKNDAMAVNGIKVEECKTVRCSKD